MIFYEDELLELSSSDLGWVDNHIIYPCSIVCTIYTPCILHLTFGRRIMSLLALCWPNETVWGPRVKILLLLSLKPSCKRFLHTFTHSLCHYVICPFVIVSLVGIQKKTFRKTHMSLTWRLLHQIRGGFFGDMGLSPYFGPSFFTRRHEGDLRFWDILGRWLHRVELGFFYIFLLPEEVKDWRLSANWPLTLMERIHLEKDNLPRFVFFRLRHTVLLKRAKFKVCIMEKPL